MIRILQVIGSLNSGGSQSMIMNLYRNIDRAKIQFDFIVDHKEELYFAEEIKKLGGKIFFMPRFKGTNLIEIIISWKKFFREHPEYKIIHSHVRSYATIFLNIAKKNGLYTIIHSHSTSNGKGLTSFIKRILQYRLRFIADYFMGCSKEANEWLFGKKIANSDKCIVFNNGIDMQKFVFDSEIRRKIKNKYNIKEEEIVIRTRRSI